MIRAAIFLICLFYPFFISAFEVDIVANFDLKGVPSKILNENHEFKVNRTSPIHYLAKSGHDSSLKKIIVFDLPNAGNAPKIFPNLPKEKLILFVWEPKIFRSDIYDLYAKVYTWDDTLVDNVKFFRFNYPYLMPFRESSLSLMKKKLCTIIAAHWTKERLNILEFFETYHPEDLDCYGRKAPPELKDPSLYKGAISGGHSGEEKISILQNYRFCICFENTVGLQGYITEKIFSCFAAGCVPIYWGADNIADYIPKSCFIDYRDFENDAKLYKYITSMSEERYSEYIKEIQNYLESEKAQLFSPQFFDNLLYEIITQ